MRDYPYLGLGRTYLDCLGLLLSGKGVWGFNPHASVGQDVEVVFSFKVVLR